MINWFKKLFGLHACEEFTRWTERTQITHRAPEGYEIMVADEVKIFRRFQERQCTVCGKIQWKQLPYVEPL